MNSLMHRVHYKRGEVMAGWTAEHWADRLRNIACACESAAARAVAGRDKQWLLNRASELRAEADVVERTCDGVK